MKSFPSRAPHPVWAKGGLFQVKGLSSRRERKTCIPFKLFTQFFTQSPDLEKYLIQLSPNQRHNVIDLHLIQFPALLNLMPLLNAFPATGSGCMLVFPKFRKLYGKTVYNSLTERLPILIIPFL